MLPVESEGAVADFSGEVGRAALPSLPFAHFPPFGRMTPDSSHTQQPSGSVRASMSDEALRVLVIDDEEPHAEAVAESLRRVGHECVVATSGSAGARRI